MLDSVLFVDDEPNLLVAIARALRNRFDIRTATGGWEGLQLLETSGPVAVVVSDMRMPEMDGVQFLSKVRDLYPDTVRIILSGQSDLTATIAAVNEGNIFRFLSKPCAAQALSAAVGTAIEQYQLITAEKVLLEQTLSGAVNMLVEILSVVTPAAYARARRMQGYVVALATALGLREHWQWPLAAVLSQIGCMTLPKDTLSKVEAGERLTEEERCLFDLHPHVAGRMLEAIPRLEDVAVIVSRQNSSLKDLNVSEDRRQWDVCLTGRILLRAAGMFDDEIVKRGTPVSAAEALRSADSGLPNVVIDALRLVVVAGGERVMRKLRLVDLAPGMLLDEALLTRRGACLVPAGREVTPTLLLRLRSIAADVKLIEPFRVQVLV